LKTLLIRDNFFCIYTLKGKVLLLIYYILSYEN